MTGKISKQRDDMVGNLSDLKYRLRLAGLRPTQQRIRLAHLLFAHGHRHVTAEKLYEEACENGINVSLATVYNTLNQFTRVRMLREVALAGAKTYFDTNTEDHHHFYIKETGEIRDITEADIKVSGIPSLPSDNMCIESIDIIVHIRDKIKSKNKTISISNHAITKSPRGQDPLV